MTEAEQEHRDAFALALRAIADKVCDNPDWPVELYPKIHVSASRAEKGGIEEVDRAAAAFGVQPHWEANGNHYTAETKVGPIKVSITAIKSEHMTQYNAAQRVADEWLEKQRAEKEIAADPNTCPRCKRKPKLAGMDGCWDCIGICHEGGADHRCPICADDTNA